jgi:integrase
MPSCNGGALKSAVGKGQWSGCRSPTQGDRRSGSNRSAAAPHACGYALTNKGHDTRAIQGWLGHRSITSTAVYTALAPNRFKDFWRE